MRLGPRRATARQEEFEVAVRLSLPPRAPLARVPIIEQPGRCASRTANWPAGCAYFLWSSMPDGELSELAERRTYLHEPEVLELQVRRMLSDSEMAEDFAGQWLRVGSLAEMAEPDKRLFPEYTTDCDAMVEEIAYFHAILREDRPVLELFESRTLLPDRLAQHYGLAGVAGTEFPGGSSCRTAGVAACSAWRHADADFLPEADQPRAAGQVGSWSCWARPRRRPGDGQGDADGRPDPQRLDVPAANWTSPQAAIRTCHSRLDPLGFGLENYDVLANGATRSSRSRSTPRVS